MSRRRLRPDEVDLWNRVARSADPLHPDRPAPKPVSPVLQRSERSETPPPPEPIPPFRIGEGAPGGAPDHHILPGLPEELAAQPVAMDKKAYQRLKRGKLVPEGRIDLHGMTLDQARPVLTSFIMRAHAQDRRLVLVITGKGKRTEDTGPIPVRPGVLRHNVPRWLKSPPLSQMVLQVTQAHARHGGTGAYYVYLRRKR